jgi:hypothetical protein
MNPQSLRLISVSLLAAITLDVAPALAQNSKPNVVFILDVRGGRKVFGVGQEISQPTGT